jgi:uncharacterized protein (TIGR02270 family)
LSDFAKRGEERALVIQGCGLVGDPKVIPWLLERMRDPRWGRGAGEAFSLITGVDLAAMRLDGDRPSDFEPGPSDDPEDPNVDLDADEGLPWPDVAKLESWWTQNADRFRPGVRHFMGKLVTREHCVDILRRGYQRQRVLAAQYLCLLEPGTPLFNTSAPAWRQQRLLAKM